MKRIYTQFLLLLTVVFSISLQAQTLPTVNNDEFLMNSDGTFSDLQPVLAGRCSGCEVPDLNFNWSNSFDAAVLNETYIRRAAKKKAREWYERQKVVIENFLENKYHKQFSSFNEAKDYAFIDFESKNMTINVDPIVSTKNSDRIRRALKKKVHIKGLKALKIREAEIKAGNTNRPLYPDFEVNGTPLKDLKSTAAVTSAYNNLLNQFVDNTWKEFEGRHIMKILGLPFNNKVLKTKNNYYGNLGTWDKLDFMQFTIHYESIINRPAPIPWSEREIKLFNKYLDKANTVTATYVENYINANKESEMSLFHPNYWKIIWKRDYKGNPFSTKAAKNKHQQLKRKELSRLISSTTMNATSTIDYLVSLLKITDKDQLQWLNDHPSKGDEFVKEISEAKVKDANMPPPIPGELSFPPDHHQQLAQWDIRTELKNGAVVGGLIRELGITNKSQKDWLYENRAETDKIISFVDSSKVNDKIEDNTKSIITDYLNIIEGIPNAKFNRYEELLDLFENNPFVLLQDCIQENGLAIENYQQLYNHTLPRTCKERLNNLGGGYNDQPLNAGNAAVANVDYYGVEITKNPDFNVDGKPDTNAEVFQAYKRNFTSWASGSKKDFQFSCDIPFDSDDKANVSWKFVPYGSTDATIWNSANPLTAIIGIDASSDIPFGDAISDDGAIMISAYTSQYWIGSTIQTPFSGTQPFSGNRQWGYLTNQKGNLELYARAVDVARVSGIIRFSEDNSECSENTYYNIGEATWSNLQEQIKTWVNANGGVATVVPKTAIRFDKTKLKELLESNETINQINCK
ncbi:hypothetical protein MK851_13635 [Tenacibaculum sp. 1B UA]|uniref:hypothetical protein n=1 Tax=Tenacibaculum sp. 1B UA TaxID=2922252 RepID=UPI002A248F84|nr:hypothetical protein [Tenacibaculum sp. 1B UA]MDX8554659.1 hypothetical protein [Tenacibaculum sp. 1B UA]